MGGSGHGLNLGTIATLTLRDHEYPHLEFPVSLQGI
jgi:hypothetical protein